MNKELQRYFEQSLLDEWDLSIRPDGQYAFGSLRDLYNQYLEDNDLQDNSLPSKEPQVTVKNGCCPICGSLLGSITYTVEK